MIMRKIISLAVCALLALSLLAVPASAAGLRGQDPPAAQYTSQGPVKGAKGCILYEDFESCASPEAAGFFASTQEKDNEVTYYEYPDCEIALSTEHAHSGARSLKVYHRDLVDNSTKGHHTFIYKGTNDYNTIGALVTANYSGSAPHTDTYFFRAWVYTDTPQTFMFQMQYGGTLEFWAPNDDYYDVEAKTWTLIGGYVQDGVTYYSSMLEDFAGAGVYPPRAASTWTGLKATTRNKDQVNTWGDFWVDDIALWKVYDNSYLFNFNKEKGQIEDLNGVRPTTTTTTKKTTKPVSGTTTKPVSGTTTTTKPGDVSGESAEPSDVSGESGEPSDVSGESGEPSEVSLISGEEITTTTAAQGDTTEANTESDDNGGGLGWVLWAIIGAAVLLIGGGVAAFLLLRKKG